MQADRIDPRTSAGMREVTLRGVELCRMAVEHCGYFKNHFALVVGDHTEEFTLSRSAAAGSLSRILEEAHNEARERRAEVLFLLLQRRRACRKEARQVEQWDSILAITQTRQRTAIALLPFRPRNPCIEFGELETGECETETFATPEVIFSKIGHVLDASMLEQPAKTRAAQAEWN